MNSINRTFAKLFEKDGRQVLVTTEQDDDDCPAINFRAQTKSGHKMDITISFGEGAWDKRDEAFSNVTEDGAFSIIQQAPGMSL